MKAVAGPIHEHVEKMTAPLVRRIAELESRADTAAERGLEYVGTFQRAARYRKGSVCTDGGSAWVALKDIEGERPGTGEGWQLMVKAGRDSRS
jgi:hypothetical protein